MIRGGGDPRQAWLPRRPQRMGPPPGTSPPMRMAASWSGSTSDPRIQECRRDVQRPLARSPRFIVELDLERAARDPPAARLRSRLITQWLLTSIAPYKPAPDLIRGAPRHRPDPPRDAPPRRRRAGHWAHQGRAPDGPQLSQRARRRPHQRRARRRRLQLQPAPALARAPFARLNADPARHPGTSPKRLKNTPHRFFTDDSEPNEPPPLRRIAAMHLSN